MLRNFRDWIERQPDTEPQLYTQLTRTVYKLDQLPTLSETAVRAMAIAKDEETSLQEFAEVIRRDGGVATSVLKLANSVVYRGGYQARTLDQAVIRLGIGGCKSLITAITMRAVFHSQQEEIQSACELLWQHSFFAATLASSLNEQFALGFAGEEFTAALLHDLGRLIIAVSVPDWFRMADPMDFREEPGFWHREQALLGNDHCRIGADFARKNRLPEAVTEAIQFHHCPTEATEHRRLVALVSMADHVANHVQRERKISNYDPDQSIGYQFLAASWKPKCRQEHRAAIGQAVVRAIKEARTLIQCQA